MISPSVPQVDIVDIEGLQENLETVKKDPSILSEFIDKLPRMALSLGIRVVLFVVIFLICSRLIQLLSRLMRKALELKGSSRNVINFLDNVLKWVLYLLLVLILAINFGMDASSIVAIIGSLGVTIALGLQGSLANFAGGVLILLLKPFEAGNYIKDINTGVTGTVEEVQLFYTKVRTDNNFEAMIPNGHLASNSIVNYTRLSDRQLIMQFQISYDSDVDKARSLLLGILEGKDCLTKDAPREPKVFLKSLDDSGVTLELRAFVTHEKYIDYCMFTWEINEKAKKLFAENGIEIPFPQVDVNFDSGVFK